MDELLAWDDVLIIPKFSNVRSRKDVDTTQFFLGLKLTTPCISSNMDTVTDSRMAAAMALNGGIGALHRFQSIEDNVEEFCNTMELVESQNLTVYSKPIVSVGIGHMELERALALEEAGATHFLIDIAHGASIQAVEQYDKLRLELHPDAQIIVGNFSDTYGILAFNEHSTSKRMPDAYKVGIGGGSLCTTRIVTGCGAPTLASIIDCKYLGFTIIADGGIRNSGDLAKALGAGASVAMIGGLLAGTDEAPGEAVEFQDVCTGRIIVPDGYGYMKYSGPIPETKQVPKYKKYRGSASQSSYETQGKTDTHRAPEGESTLIPYKGPAKAVLDNLMGGLRSAMSYTDSLTLQNFREHVKFSRVTNAGVKESKPHGKQR